MSWTSWPSAPWYTGSIPASSPSARHARVEVHVSGGEYNVAANLSDCFGLRTGIATAMVDYAMGELVESRLREAGVTPFCKRFEHDGVRGPNIATVYSDRGQGVRPPVVFYNRANEAAAMLRPGDFDWPAIFGRGVRWFHTGGIFAALSETTSELVLEAIEAAQAAGAVTSFDLNYRAKLWAARGGDAQAQQVIRRIAGRVDVLFGNEEDLQKGLGLSGPDVHAKSKLDPAAFFELMGQVVRQYPNVKTVATTLREVQAANRHDWAAVMWHAGRQYATPVMHLDVLCRIGGGDGFAAGLIYGLLAGRGPEESLRLGWAHGALLTTYPGDVSMAKLSEVEALANGGSARVQR